MEVFEGWSVTCAEKLWGNVWRARRNCRWRGEVCNTFTSEGQRLRRQRWWGEVLYIDCQNYGNRYALYAFDMTADLGEDDHFSLVREGSMRLMLMFDWPFKPPWPPLSTRNSNTWPRSFATGTSSSTLEYELRRDWACAEVEMHWRLCCWHICHRWVARQPRTYSWPTPIPPADLDVIGCVYERKKDGHREYFDSFGRWPTVHSEHNMERHCSSWMFNRRQLQSVMSRFCRHYCIYYCMLRSRCVDMFEIVNSLTVDTGLNDVLVHIFACVRE